MVSDAVAPGDVHRRLRLVAILYGAEEAGLTPLPLADLHNIAYLADALAPVWGLRIPDTQLLKRRAGAFSPVLQHDLDRLVGRGVVRPFDIQHLLDADNTWRLAAQYSLVRLPGARIIDTALAFEDASQHVRFVVEVVHAMSALGIEGIARASAEDATYASPSIDFGSMIDLSGGALPLNATSRVAMRFGTLLGEDLTLTSAEMTHLYVKELYKRLGHAA